MFDSYIQLTVQNQLRMKTYAGLTIIATHRGKLMLEVLLFVTLNIYILGLLASLNESGSHLYPSHISLPSVSPARNTVQWTVRSFNVNLGLHWFNAALLISFAAINPANEIPEPELCSVERHPGSNSKTVLSPHGITRDRRRYLWILYVQCWHCSSPSALLQ